jgi:hypothetical protein
MFDDILRFYKDYGCTNLILTSDVIFVLEIISKNQKNGLTINVIDDARSATFFALGRINVTGKPVILFTSSEGLASSLTGLTEANYQYLPLIIFSIGEEHSDLNIECYKFVTKKVLIATENEKGLIFQLEDYFHNKWFKPLLIQLKYKRATSSNKKNISSYDVTKCILNACVSHSQIFIEDNLDTEVMRIAEQKEVYVNSKKSLYGVISSFLGHAAVNANVQYLVTSYDKIIKEINVFNLRYIKNNVVIIYLKALNNKQKFDSWFVGNNFKFTRVTSLTELQENVAKHSDKPVIIEFGVPERS